MTKTQIKQELRRELDQLPLKSQKQVLDFARSLKNGTPPGMSGKEFVRRFAGLFSDQDAREIMAAIEEDCERIDEDGWK